MGVNELREIWAYIETHLWLKASGIVLFYLVLAKLADLLIDRVLRRLAALTKVTFDDDIIRFLHWPVVLNIALLGPLHALYALNLGERSHFIGTGIIKSLIVLFWWITAFRFIRWLALRKFPIFVKFGHLGADLVILIKNLCYALVSVAGAVALLNIWHINLAPLLASAGIAGIAVALAAKETLANFFGGISIFLDRTYKVGDYIILDSGERGEVVDVGIRSTRIRTRDDVLITIPNSIMANSKIINESAPEPRFRLRLPVGVAYESDLEKVEKVLLEVVGAVPHVVSEPAPRIRYRRFGDSSIDLELLCWVDDPRNKGR